MVYVFSGFSITPSPFQPTKRKWLVHYAPAHLWEHTHRVGVTTHACMPCCALLQVQIAGNNQPSWFRLTVGDFFPHQNVCCLRLILLTINILSFEITETFGLPSWQITKRSMPTTPCRSVFKISESENVSVAEEEVHD